MIILCSILAYVQAVEAGRIAERKDVMGGYYVLDVLALEGCVLVRKTSDGSIHFAWESMPYDSTPSLVYCPHSQSDLRQLNPIGGGALIRGQFLDNNWFYCEADD